MTETSAAQAGPSDPAAVRGGAGPRPWQQHYFWLITALVAVAALVIGGSVQHYFDQRRAARALYGSQLLSAASRFLGEQNRQIVLPTARRSIGAFDRISNQMNADQGFNGEGTLDVELGSGSTGPLRQIAVEAIVSSPYASTTVVVWTVRYPGGDPGDVSQGTCLLSSSLEGTGRATTDLHFGSELWGPCTADLWRPSAAAAGKPDLALTPISTSGR